MDKRREDIVFSQKFKAGRRRTYFFDIRETRGGDKYATITESKRRDNGDGYDRHKLFIYKEDLTRFRDNLNELIEEMQAQMPDYDFDEFARRAKERDRLYHEQLAAEAAEKENQSSLDEMVDEVEATDEVEMVDEIVSDVELAVEEVIEDKPVGTIEEDDLSW